MKVILNQTALDNLDKNIEYLKQKWTQNEIINFFELLDKKIELLRKNPEMGTICEFKPLLRELVINNHIKMYYEVEPHQIYIHLFWSTHRNPSDLEMLLL